MKTTGRSRYRGFASLDALFSLMPLVLIVFIMMDASARLAHDAHMKRERQVIFDSLVSAADYTTRSGAVVRRGDVRFPNWIDGALLTESYVSGIREREGLGSLHIGFREPEGPGSMCIYRLVASGGEREIKKLYVCGG